MDHEKKDEPQYGVAILTTLLHPKSAGKVSLNSSDPQDHPLIFPNYLDHPDGMQQR